MSYIEQPGKYFARAIGAEFGFTKNGSEQVAVLFETVNGEQITWWGYFSEKATPHTLTALKRCGWDGADLAELTGLGEKEVELDVQWDEYQGQQNLRVKWINAANAPMLRDQMSPEQRAAFAARMKGQVMAHAKAEQAAAAPAPPAPTAAAHGAGQRPPAARPPAARPRGQLQQAADGGDDQIPF